MPHTKPDLLNGIAIIGMGCYFPDADNATEFWDHIFHAKESIKTFTSEELIRLGVAEEEALQATYVNRGVSFTRKRFFDAAFFNYSPGEAKIMDPQQRLLLECAYHAMEDAGYVPQEESNGLVGVYLGTGLSSYLIYNLLSHKHLQQNYSNFQLTYANHSAATQLSYKMNLRGPSVEVNTACSTSLVATHMACRSLLYYECDMALAGGASVQGLPDAGYHYQKDGILAKDGYCKPFDATATGTVSGQGAGVVLLKRYEDAIRDGDHIYAVIRGSAINNDGSQKVGYAAPSVKGQIEVIRQALAIADVSPDSINYIECHGTGTAIGDPIEFAALADIFASTTPPTHPPCYLGSVKANIGHLNAAAGIAGLIKTVQVLQNRQIPPLLHFQELNSKINLDKTRLSINKELITWDNENLPYRAGVSSFGIGGTNAHVILEAYYQPSILSNTTKPYLLTLSAKSLDAFSQKISALICFLKANPHINLSNVAYTLNIGREPMRYRYYLVCKEVNEAIKQLNILHELYLTVKEVSMQYSDTPIEEKINELVLLYQSEKNSQAFQYEHVLEQLGEFWSKGYKIDWKNLYSKEKHHRISLPVYPFDKKSYWIKINNQETGAENLKNNCLTDNIKHARPSLSTPYRAPQSIIEKEVSEMWSRFLSIDHIGIDDDFFDLGGDSLIATQINISIFEKYQTTIKHEQIFNTPTIAGIVNAIMLFQLQQFNSEELRDLLSTDER